MATARRMLCWRNKRLRLLADPRKRDDNMRPEWRLTPALKHYKPTKRIVQLAQPVTRGKGAFYASAPHKSNRHALNYQPASERILQLAIAPAKPPDNIDLRKDPYRIPKRALRAKPTPRVMELAAPKEFQSVTRFDPFVVSKSALRAKPSHRILVLAKPKQPLDPSSYIY